LQAARVASSAHSAMRENNLTPIIFLHPCRYGRNYAAGVRTGCSDARPTTTIAGVRRNGEYDIDLTLHRLILDPPVGSQRQKQNCPGRMLSSGHSGRPRIVTANRTPRLR
jgi:hypothetical protein